VFLDLLLLFNANFLCLWFNLRGAARLELLHASCGVDELLFAGVERMALCANFNADLFLSGAGYERVAAGADDLRLWKIVRVDSCFHDGVYYMR